MCIIDLNSDIANGMRRSPKAPNTQEGEGVEEENDPKEGIKSITGRWGRNESNSSQRSGEVLGDGFATEQGKHVRQRGLCNS